MGTHDVARYIEATRGRPLLRCIREHIWDGGEKFEFQAVNEYPRSTRVLSIQRGIEVQMKD